MPHTFEIVWALLPLFFVVLVLVSLVKKMFGSKLNIPIKDYLIQLVFCLVCFAVSILIVRSDLFLQSLTYFPLSLIPIEVYQWVLYPVILVIASLIVDKRSHEDSNKRLFKLK